MPITIKDLFIYPLKAAAAVSVDEVEITKRGLKNDRLWMLVFAEDDPERKKKRGDFISQRIRGIERLALVKALPNENGGLRVSIFDDRFILDVHGIPEKKFDGEVFVHGNPCEALDAGDKAAEFFTRFLGLNCRLVRIPDDFVRRPNQNFYHPDDQVSYADGAPILVTSTTSLESLSAHFGGANVDMSRFRPNIVLEGLKPFQEDGIKCLGIGSEAGLSFVKPCERCSVPLIDQFTGVSSGNQPLKALSSQRKGTDNNVYFGQNAAPLCGEGGLISKSDEIRIIATESPADVLSTVKLGWH